MKLYTAGPMTGIPQFNYPAFIALAAQLRAAGIDVVSPAELDDPEDRAAALASPDGRMLHYTGKTGKTWGDFLARDVKLLADDGINGVVVLPGWERSRGARLETFVANALCGLPIYTFESWQPENGGWLLTAVPPLQLYRAWSGTDDIYINHSYGVRTDDDPYEYAAALARDEWLRETEQ